MQTACGFVLATVASLGIALVPGIATASSGQTNDDIWTEQQGQDSSERRFNLTKDEVERIMSELKKTDPEKAKALEQLRKKDRNKFQDELRRNAGEEYGRIIRERIEAWRSRRRTDFLNWLEKSYPKEARELSKLKDKEDYYWKKYDIIRSKYSRIYEEERRSPELAKVLKEDLQLQNKRDDLLSRLERAKDESEKKKIAEQLQQVVSRRFDLIVRRKQIAYQLLSKRIEDLQRRLEASKQDIAKWRNRSFKDTNVEQRLKELTGDKKFNWD